MVRYMDELISIIVPVYNVEDYVYDSVQSIMKQTYKNLEIILIDDGSSDRSGKICDELASEDNRIKVYHIANGGVSNARNLGIDKSKGKFIMFVDSDDAIAQDSIEVLYECMIRNDTDCAMCGCNRVRTNKTIKVNSCKNSIKILDRDESIECLCCMKSPFHDYEITAVWGTLYKRELIADIRFNPIIRIGEDFEFKYRVFLRMNYMVCLDSCNYFYLIRETSAMRNGFNPNKLTSVEGLKQLLYEERYSKYSDLLLSRVVNICFVVLFMIPMNSECRMYRTDIITFIKQHRLRVLLNKKARLKVKVALLLSFLGFKTCQKLYMKR